MIEYFINNMWQAWLLLGIIFLILELTNGDFFIMCFAIGSVFAAIASAVSDSLVVQIITFAVFTLLSLAFVRPVALRWLHKNEDTRVSNADALIGREGRVSEPIPAGGYGRVAIDGDDWKAESADGSEIAKDEKVTVVGRESIIITITKN